MACSWSALSSCSARGTFQSARGREAVLFPSWKQDVQENLESSTLTGTGRLFQGFGLLGEAVRDLIVSPESS